MVGEQDTRSFFRVLHAILIDMPHLVDRLSRYQREQVFNGTFKAKNHNIFNV
jgi:hypothetical protein